LANMSHEIRTPMNAILGFSEILLAGSQNIKEKRLLQTIYSSGQSLLTLINDILDLSKIESGKFKLCWDQVNIEHLLNEIYQFFSYKAREKGIDIQIKMKNNIPNVISDKARLRQILINLAGNAVKFTQKGYIKITAKGEQTGTDIMTLILEIKDTGAGIPVNQQEKIFESFQQQTGQKLGQYGGTGLGLSISKKLTEMMGGNISVISEIGKGSIFRLTFPKMKISNLQNKTVSCVSDNKGNKNIDIISEPPVIIEFNAEKDCLSFFNELDKKNISEEQKARLPELIKILENEFIPQWKEIKDVFFIDDIAKFANKLKLLGKQYRLDYLKKYGEILYLKTENIEIEIIEKLIKGFPKIIEIIKNI